MGAIVELRQVTKIYEGKNKKKTVAVDAIDLSVQSGELFGLLGPNGAGKTTTLNICTTRSSLTSGSAFISGVDVSRDPARARGFIGIVPQHLKLDFSCSVQENVYFHCRYYGFSHSEARHRTKELLEQFSLAERAKSMLGELSGGLAQRLQVAKAVAHRPDILFLDEPTSRLDPQTRLAVWDIIRSLCKEGMTIVITTHNMGEADALCGRLAIIDHGKILVCDTPKSLKSTLGADSIVDVNLKHPQPERAAEIRELPGVSGVDCTAKGYRVHSRALDGLLPKILEVTGTGHLHEIAVIEPSLETVFITLTGREMRE